MRLLLGRDIMKTTLATVPKTRNDEYSSFSSLARVPKTHSSAKEIPTRTIARRSVSRMWAFQASLTFMCAIVAIVYWQSCTAKSSTLYLYRGDAIAADVRHKRGFQRFMLRGEYSFRKRDHYETGRKIMCDRRWAFYHRSRSLSRLGSMRRALKVELIV